MPRKKKKRKYRRPEVDRVVVSMTHKGAAKTFNREEEFKADPKVWYEGRRHVYCRVVCKLEEVKKKYDKV